MGLLTPTAPAAAPAQPGATSQAPAPMIPFVRASRPKSGIVTTLSATPTTAQITLNPIQVRPSGFLARVRLTVTGVTSANAATVVFQPDAPFNVLQQIGFSSPAGDTIYSTFDGFTLYCVNKYFALATGRRDPVADPTYSVTTGVGAGLGGSFKFMIDVPIEVDSRDAFGVLMNMAANQQFVIQASLNTIAGIYSTAPTTAPVVTIIAVMEYYSSPDSTNGDGIAQQQQPSGAGSLSLLQIQTPPIVANTTQRIQLINVGSVIRCGLFILRNSSGVRTEADWPVTTNLYINGDLHFYKNKDLWRSQHAIEYNLTGGIAASPTVNTLDAGVYPFTDFINRGGMGGMKVDGASNRNLWLVTGSGTGFEIEAGTAWGANAFSLLAVQNTIKPITPQALYVPELY